MIITVMVTTSSIHLREIGYVPPNRTRIEVGMELTPIVRIKFS